MFRRRLASFTLSDNVATEKVSHLGCARVSHLGNVSEFLTCLRGKRLSKVSHSETCKTRRSQTVIPPSTAIVWPVI